MKKIKVLHISETFAAGVYMYIKDVSQFLKKNTDVDNYVIYSGNRQDTNKDRFPVDFPQSTKLIEISMSREISPLNDLKSFIAILKKIREIKPDVIHIHSSKAGVIGRIAAKFYGKSKLYYTPHGYSFLRQDISTAKQKLFLNIEKYTAKFFGGITIACGDTEYEHAKKIGKALLVRNGVDIEKVSKFNDNSKKSNHKFTVGTMGRLTIQKNPALFNSIALKMPDINFVWIGDGEFSNEITANNITVTGWLAREEALSRINSLDVYTQTSLWEGLPFTILEAMALNQPIIANNVIGNKDAVKHNYNGLLCNSLNEFVAAINSLKEDNDLKNRMAINSSLRVKELFNINKNFEKLIDIYKS